MFRANKDSVRQHSEIAFCYAPSPQETASNYQNVRNPSRDYFITNFVAAQLHVKSIELNETLHVPRYDKYLGLLNVIQIQQRDREILTTIHQK